MFALFGEEGGQLFYKEGPICLNLNNAIFASFSIYKFTIKSSKFEFEVS